MGACLTRTKLRTLLVRPAPPCFPDVAMWVLWGNAAMDDVPAENGLGRAIYCIDCTQNYQREMLARRLCIRPDVLFRQDADGWIEGYAER